MIVIVIVTSAAVFVVAIATVVVIVASPQVALLMGPSLEDIAQVTCDMCYVLRVTCDV